MAFRKQIALLLLLIGHSSMSFAMDDLRAQISQMETEERIQQQNIQALRNDLDRKTLEIEKIKIKQSDGIVSKLFLQKKLREAQYISKQLETLVKKNSQLNKKLFAQRGALLNQIDNEIQTLFQTKESVSQLQTIQGLIAEKDGLLISRHKTMLTIPSLNFSPTFKNEKDDLIAKLQVIEDLQKNMREKITLLKDEVSEEQSKKFLRNEIAHFLTEENFFGEQSFISSGLNRKDSANGLSALALKKEAAPIAQPADPTSDPTGTPTTADTVEIAEPQVSSLSTSFQQPEELMMFKNLSEQIEASIQDTNPKDGVKSDKTKSRKLSKKEKRTPLQQSLALSEKILGDLEILHGNIVKQIQELE